jgi:DNA-binding response OmpR family regulator
LKILLIEDEAKIADFVLKGLADAGFAVTHVNDGEQGLQAILQTDHDLVVLDLMLPKLNGYDVLRQAREQGIKTPVIILSAKADLQDRLIGFDVGADDYLPKPFFVEELAARIKAVMHRKAPAQSRLPELLIEITQQIQPP